MRNLTVCTSYVDGYLKNNKSLISVKVLCYKTVGKKFFHRDKIILYPDLNVQEVNRLTGLDSVGNFLPSRLARKFRRNFHFDEKILYFGMSCK